MDTLCSFTEARLLDSLTRPGLDKHGKFLFGFLFFQAPREILQFQA